MRHHSSIASLFLLSAVAMVLVGCGGSDKKANEPAAFRGIYTTSGDCSDSGKLSVDQCVEAMEKAVAEHEKSAPSYSSLRSCEATEGVGQCERTHAANFRPILLAFLVTASKPPVAKPLYASGDAKKVGFRTAAKEFFLTQDEAVVMSEHAQTLAEASIPKKAAKGKGAFGG